MTQAIATVLFWVAVLLFAYPQQKKSSEWVKVKPSIEQLKQIKENNRLQFIRVDAEMQGYITMLEGVEADSLAITNQNLLKLLKGQ